MSIEFVNLKLRALLEAGRRPKHQAANKWEQQLKNRIKALIEKPQGWEHDELGNILTSREYGFAHNEALSVPLFNRDSYINSLRPRIVWRIDDLSPDATFILTRHARREEYGWVYLFDYIEADDPGALPEGGYTVYSWTRREDVT